MDRLIACKGLNDGVIDLSLVRLLQVGYPALRDMQAGHACRSITIAEQTAWSLTLLVMEWLVDVVLEREGEGSSCCQLCFSSTTFRVTD